MRNSDDSAGIRSDALYTFEGWLNNVITRATLQALGVWDHRRTHLVDRRTMVGGRDLLYKLDHGYHGRALNANGPNTHYRDVCVVDVVGPDFTCDATDPERLIEGTPSRRAMSTTGKSGTSSFKGFDNKHKAIVKAVFQTEACQPVDPVLRRRDSPMKGEYRANPRLQ